MAALNELLAASAAKDDARHVTTRRLTVGEHLALEVEVLKGLPAEQFDVSGLENPRVDRKSRVSVRSCLYSVPVHYVGRRLDARVGAETIDIYSGSTVVAHHARGLKGDEVLTLDHYLEVLAIKPGALAGATALARARAAGSFGPTHERFWTDARRRLGDRDGTKALIEVLLLHRTLPATQVAKGIDRALKAGSVDPAVVAIEARRAAETAESVVIPLGEGLGRFDRPAPSIAPYDQLLQAQ